MFRWCFSESQKKLVAKLDIISTRRTHTTQQDFVFVVKFYFQKIISYNLYIKSFTVDFCIKISILHTKKTDLTDINI